MINSLNNNKGVAFIICLIVIVVLMVFAAVFLSISISEKGLAQREKDSTAAFYLTARGMEYAYREMIHGPWSGWHTHNAVLGPNSSSVYDLEVNGNGPGVYLTSKCRIDHDDKNSPTYGCYVPLLPSTGAVPQYDFVVKTYADPARPDYTIILSKGIFGSVTQTLAAVVYTQSLYQYFIFAPRGLSMNQTTYNAGGGKIHANSDTTWYEHVILQDVSEFSTYGAFQYGYVPYVPPDDYGINLLPNNDWDAAFWWMRFPWTNPVNLQVPEPVYTNNPDGHQYGCNWGALPLTYVQNLPSFRLPGNLPNQSIWTTIQNGPAYGTSPIQIPSYLPDYLNAVPYNVNEYMEIPLNNTPPPPLPQISINLLNSVNQHSDWTTFTENNGLSSVLQDLLTGAQYIEPLTINPTTYRLSAEEGGMYIKKNTDPIIGNVGELMVKLTNQSSSQWYGGFNNPPVPDFIQEVSFYNTNSGNQYVFTSPENDDRVVEIDVSEMTDHTQWQPSNGIVYCTKHLLIKNGSELPQELPGITWVTQGHGMIQGDYNSDADPDTYRPSALITAGLPYVLSNQFDVNYYANHVMDTFYHLDYPYASGPFGYQENWNKNVNWYASHVDEMPNKVTQDINVNLSIVGPQALNVQQLELWGYYTNSGTATPPCQDPSGWVSFNRNIQGAFVALTPSTFAPNYNYEVNPPEQYPSHDPNRESVNDGSQSRADQYGNTRNYHDPSWRCPGWPYNMTSVRPDQEHVLYETRYFPENGPAQLPPGMLLGFTHELWMPVYNDFYFNHHNPAFSYIAPQAPPPPPVEPPPIYMPPFYGKVLD